MDHFLGSRPAESQRAIKKAMRSHVRRWGLRNTDDIYLRLQIDASASDKAIQLVDRFLAADDMQTAQLPAGQNSATDVLTRYFSSAPPFAKNIEKKHEFPDAFALLSLEAWAQQNGTKILCVSPDKGWQEFCETSEHLVCIDNLDTALSFFNQAFQDIADTIVARWKDGAIGDYIDHLSYAFEDRLGDLNFDIEATTDMYFEAEAIEASLQNIDRTSVSEPVVISSGENTITFHVFVDATVAFKAMFGFSVYDGIDKEMVHLATQEAETEKELTFNLTITARREFDEIPEFESVEVSRESLEVDFGHVDAFPNEDPNDPRY